MKKKLKRDQTDLLNIKTTCLHSSIQYLLIFSYTKKSFEQICKFSDNHVDSMFIFFLFPITFSLGSFVSSRANWRWMLWIFRRLSPESSDWQLHRCDCRGNASGLLKSVQVPTCWYPYRWRCCCPDSIHWRATQFNVSRVLKEIIPCPVWVWARVLPCESVSTKEETCPCRGCV